MRATTLVLFCIACGGEPVASAPNVVASAAPSASASASACADSPRPSDSYEPAPAWSGRAANIPDPPSLPTTPQREGDAYTVYGAIRALHAIDAAQALSGDVTIVGTIVDTNLPRAPKCVLHKTGRADPERCVSEIPTFTIADAADASPSAPRIRVMGWASSFANVYEAFLREAAHQTTPWTDELWAVELPMPLPAVGAKVKLTGRYGARMTLASSGVVSDPRSGILTLRRAETLTRAATPARFPQLR